MSDPETRKGVVLVVDDEPLKRMTLQIELAEAGFEAYETADAVSAMQMIRTQPIDVVVTDLRMPGVDGLSFLDQVKVESPRTHVIVMTAFGTIDTAVEAIKRGAYDYLAKPFETSRLLDKLIHLRSSAEWLSRQSKDQDIEQIGDLVGRSHAARRFFDQLKSVAGSDASVWLQGETGTGALRIARAIHDTGPRANGPFEHYVCGASAANESELFGDSSSSTAPGGLLARSGGGTLFLEHVEALSPGAQSRLLACIEAMGGEAAQGEASRHVRLVCWSDEEPAQLMETGRFNPDLYYRLSTAGLSVPPLRHCKEDIPLIANRLLERYRSSHSDRQVAEAFSPHALEALSTYSWPGNLVELEHAVERAILLAQGGTIEARDILLPADKHEDGYLPGSGLGSEHTSLTETVAGVERTLIDSALRRAAGNQAKAAQYLGIPRTTLRDKMAKYGMVGGNVRRGPEPA